MRQQAASTHAVRIFFISAIVTSGLPNNPANTANCDGLLTNGWALHEGSFFSNGYKWCQLIIWNLFQTAVRSNPDPSRLTDAHTGAMVSSVQTRALGLYQYMISCHTDCYSTKNEAWTVKSMGQTCSPRFWCWFKLISSTEFLKSSGQGTIMHALGLPMCMIKKLVCMDQCAAAPRPVHARPVQRTPSTTLNRSPAQSLLWRFCRSYCADSHAISLLRPSTPCWTQHIAALTHAHV